MGPSGPWQKGSRVATRRAATPQRSHCKTRDIRQADKTWGRTLREVSIALSDGLLRRLPPTTISPRTS
jgi:hypothetical protein